MAAQQHLGRFRSEAEIDLQSGLCEYMALCRRWSVDLIRKRL